MGWVAKLSMWSDPWTACQILSVNARELFLLLTLVSGSWHLWAWTLLWCSVGVSGTRSKPDWFGGWWSTKPGYNIIWSPSTTSKLKANQDGSLTPSALRSCRQSSVDMQSRSVGSYGWWFSTQTIQNRVHTVSGLTGPTGPTGSLLCLPFTIRPICAGVGNICSRIWTCGGKLCSVMTG